MVKNPLDDELFPNDDDSLDLPVHDSIDDDTDLEILDHQDHLTQDPENPIRTTSVKPKTPRKSQFSLTTSDLIRVTASRFTYSRQYIIGYLGLTVMSLVTVSISLATPKGCPHVAFYGLEIFVLVALILEVILRAIALQRRFWSSYWNIADAVMVIICAVTLGLVFAGCSTAVRRERQSSTILLVIRNVVQVIRLGVLLWRNRHNFTNRQVDIDLDDVGEFTLLEGDE